VLVMQLLLQGTEKFLPGTNPPQLELLDTATSFTTLTLTPKP